MNISLASISGSLDDPYTQLISNFFVKDFPGTTFTGKESLVDILTKVLVGTGQVRFGPVPNPESLVAIREVIRKSLETSKPIPVLVPWGGRKTVADRGVDVAEVVALKQLNCLNHQVKEIFHPGLNIHIRIEDTGAYYLYQNEPTVVVNNYSRDFQKLVRILNLWFVSPIRESSLMNEKDYFDLADNIQGPMFEYLVESDKEGFNFQSNSWKLLLEMGWQGAIPKEQRDFYRSRYKAHDPTISDFAATKKLAEYFAGSLARYKLHGTAAPKDDYI
jgi:hypothetical protein